MIGTGTAGMELAAWEPKNQQATLTPEHDELVATYPNAIVRMAFYLSVIAIPFHGLYLPGTGDRIGVTRIVQALVILACLTQPRVCLRRVPLAVILFGAYCGVRIIWGSWLAPHLVDAWWPGTLLSMQFFIPWVWFLFNVLQYPRMGRRAIWSLGLGVSACAFLHIMGIGAVELDGGAEGRSASFGETANLGGAIYATGMIGITGMAMLQNTTARGRLLVFPLTGLMATGLAMTGSRTAALLLATGLLVMVFQPTAFDPRVKRYLTLALMGVVLAGVAYQVPTVASRFQAMTTLRSDKAAMGEARARMYPVLWEMFLRSPLYGGGPGVYRDELTRKAMPHWIKKGEMVTSHNLLLRLLVETGLVGFVIFMAGIVIAVRAAWRARAGSCGLAPLAMLLPLVTVGSVFNDPTANPAYWFAIAYALAGRN